MKHFGSEQLNEFRTLGIDSGEEVPVKQYLSTGNRALDWAITEKLDGGGYPVGRIVELFGDPSTAKSLLCGHLVTHAQKAGWWTLIDDTEGAMDPFFMQRLGVDLKSLLIMNSETVQGHFKRVSAFVNKVRSKDKETPILIVLDSLAALSTDHEREKPEKVAKVDDDPEFPALTFKAKDMSKAQIVKAGFRVLGLRFLKQNVLYVVTNHTIAQIGNTWGPKSTTPGGGGTKFHASVRIQLKKGKGFTNDEGPTGHQIIATVVKNRCAPPFKQVTFNLFFDRGMTPESGTVDILIRKGIVTENRGWYTWLGEKDKKYRDSDLEAKIPEILAWIETKKETILEEERKDAEEKK